MTRIRRPWHRGSPSTAEITAREIDPAVEEPVDNRCHALRRLHESGCFVIPNPWDAGSARALASLGFSALATTSSGLAWSHGQRDNAVSLPDTLDHFRVIAAAVTVPVSGDFEGGFAVDPFDVHTNVTAALETGVAGLSIEDASGDVAEPLFDVGLAVARVRSARQAIDEFGNGAVLTARCEGFLVGRPDLPATIARLQAYADAGADCLYAPGLSRLRDVANLVEAVAPVPVNVLVNGDFATVAELAAVGVRRISVGGALARRAWTGFLQAAEQIARDGIFTGLNGSIAFKALNDRFPSE